MQAVNKLIKRTRQGKIGWRKTYLYGETSYTQSNWKLSKYRDTIKLTYKNIVIDVPVETKLKLLDAIDYYLDQKTAQREAKILGELTGWRSWFK